jgi:hypothetical protein
MSKILIALGVTTALFASARADKNLITDTRMVGVDGKQTEQECLSRAKSAMTDLLKNNKNVDSHGGSHTWVVSTPDIVFQVECLQYDKISAAYVLAAGIGKVGSSDAVVLGKATEAIAAALKK